MVLNVHRNLIRDGDKVMSWCLMSSDVIWHIRDKLWPMPKHGSVILYVHDRRLVRTDSPGRPPRLSHRSWTQGDKGGRGILYTYRYTVSARMTPALRWTATRATLMFQQGVMDKVTRQCPQTTTFLKDVPLVEFMYLVFTRLPGESYRRRLRSLLLYLSYVFRALINSLVCWFCTIALYLVVFQTGNYQQNTEEEYCCCYL